MAEIVRVPPSLFEMRATHALEGRVEWIGLRPARCVPVTPVTSVEALADRGLQGDRRAQKLGGERQVTLIQHEHLAVIAALIGRDHIDPALLRRNLAVSGINLHALQSVRLRVGEAVFEVTGACHPCSRMEQALGHGGYNAVRHHGGITAKVLQSGCIALGDAVRVEAA